MSYPLLLLGITIHRYLFIVAERSGSSVLRW